MAEAYFNDIVIGNEHYDDINIDGHFHDKAYMCDYAGNVTLIWEKNTLYGRYYGTYQVLTYNGKMYAVGSVYTFDDLGHATLVDVCALSEYDFYSNSWNLIKGNVTSRGRYKSVICENGIALIDYSDANYAYSLITFLSFSGSTSQADFYANYKNMVFTRYGYLVQTMNASNNDVAIDYVEYGTRTRKSRTVIPGFRYIPFVTYCQGRFYFIGVGGTYDSSTGTYTFRKASFVGELSGSLFSYSQQYIYEFNDISQEIGVKLFRTNTEYYPMFAFNNYDDFRFCVARAYDDIVYFHMDLIAYDSYNGLQIIDKHGSEFLLAKSATVYPEYSENTSISELKYGDKSMYVSGVGDISKSNVLYGTHAMVTTKGDFMFYVDDFKVSKDGMSEYTDTDYITM